MSQLWDEKAVAYLLAHIDISLEHSTNWRLTAETVLATFLDESKKPDTAQILRKVDSLSRGFPWTGTTPKLSKKLNLEVAERGSGGLELTAKQVKQIEEARDAIKASGVDAHEAAANPRRMMTRAAARAKNPANAVDQITDKLGLLNVACSDSKTDGASTSPSSSASPPIPVGTAAFTKKKRVAAKGKDMVARENVSESNTDLLHKLHGMLEDLSRDLEKHEMRFEARIDEVVKSIESLEQRLKSNSLVLPDSSVTSTVPDNASPNKKALNPPRHTLSPRATRANRRQKAGTTSGSYKPVDNTTGLDTGDDSLDAMLEDGDEIDDPIWDD